MNRSSTRGARPPNPRAAARRRARGFTLIELVVAMSAGLLVSMAALMLSKNATKFFQDESRISGTQLAATLGMNRLASDVKRAAFLSSRSNSADPSLCTSGVVPVAIQNLSGLAIRVGGSVASNPAQLAQSTDPQNGLNPDSIVLSGSFDATERFAVSWASQGGGGTWTIKLQLDGAVARIRQASAQAGQSLLLGMAPIFKQGRLLHFFDDGHGQGNLWGVIDAFNVTGAVGAEDITVTLATAVALPVRSPTTNCGLSGRGGGIFVSVVSRVRYDLRSLLGDASYGPIVAPDPATVAITGEDKRTELVRTELNPDDTTMDGSIELVAELAVDLKFGVSKGPPHNDALVFNPPITVFGFDDPAVMTTPELVRGVQIKLSTRGRVPERETPLGAGGRPYRFAVLQPPIKQRFARLRTLYTTVALPNQADFSP